MFRFVTFHITFCFMCHILRSYSTFTKQCTKSIFLISKMFKSFNGNNILFLINNILRINNSVDDVN